MPAAAVLENPNPVRDSTHIGHLLMRVLDIRALLAVSVAGQSGACTSQVVELNLRDGRLLLDELHPPQAAQAVKPGSRLQLSTRMDGSALEFDCEVDQVVRVRGNLGYIARVPEEVRHHERRNAFRVMIPQDYALPPATFNGTRGSFRGRLVDVSHTGIGTVVADRNAANAGELLGCTLSLPGTRLIADVQVRSAASASGSRRLGVLFSGLNAAQKGAVAKSVATLNRDLLKRYASARWL